MASDLRDPTVAPRHGNEHRRLVWLCFLTLGIYGAYAVLRDGHIIGRLTGKHCVGFAKGVLLTVLTLGIFPGIYVVVLAFDLQRYSEARSTVGRQRYLGSMVLAGECSILGARCGVWWLGPRAFSGPVDLLLLPPFPRTRPVWLRCSLTPPSSGRATAGFAHRVPPLMSNVRPAEL